jgi:hypothetical protein
MHNMIQQGAAAVAAGRGRSGREQAQATKLPGVMNALVK